MFALIYCTVVTTYTCLAGTLMGLTNGLATIPGFAGPAVVGALTKGNVSTLSYIDMSDWF